MSRDQIKLVPNLTKIEQLRMI